MEFNEKASYKIIQRIAKCSGFDKCDFAYAGRFAYPHFYKNGHLMPCMEGYHDYGYDYNLIMIDKSSVTWMNMLARMMKSTLNGHYVFVIDQLNRNNRIYLMMPYDTIDMIKIKLDIKETCL